MDRRAFLGRSLGAVAAFPLLGARRREKFDAAAGVLAKATAGGQVRAASLCVRHRGETFARAFGEAKTPEAMFLLASVTKTITAAAVMTLVDQGKVRLEDPVVKVLPEFSTAPRDKITLAHLLTHTSGLPDQLPENQDLRRSHAGLEKFIAATVRTPLLFDPGARYSYSSMGILLASEVARRISSTEFREFVHRVVFQPLEMKRSAMGLGQFKLEDVVLNQVENAAPESGAGDPSAKEWDWNSSYWRTLGAPWGTAHSSAPDVARFYAEFLHPTGRMLKAATMQMMIRNQNPAGFVPRGIGFAVGKGAGGPGCSEKTFGHGGSSGTLVWADPESDTVSVVLTTLPSAALHPHPRELASNLVARAVS